MKSPIPFKSLLALVGALACAGAAQAATYTTQITGTNSAAFELNYIEIVWTTEVGVGSPVGESDLSDLQISFYDDSDALVYTDFAISGGVVQPIGGVARTLSDLSFDAVSGLSITSFDNDISQIQLGDAVGTTFNFYGDTSTSINVAFYLDGALQDDATFTVIDQVTTSAIPEPSAYAALAGLGALALAANRRRARA